MSLSILKTSLKTFLNSNKTPQDLENLLFVVFYTGIKEGDRIQWEDLRKAIHEAYESKKTGSSVFTVMESLIMEVVHEAAEQNQPLDLSADSIKALDRLFSKVNTDTGNKKAV